jgi:hypothetical protein
LFPMCSHQVPKVYPIWFAQSLTSCVETKKVKSTRSKEVLLLRALPMFQKTYWWANQNDSFKNKCFECTHDVINYVHYKHASNRLKPFFSKRVRSPAFCPYHVHFHCTFGDESCKCRIRRVNWESA